MDFSKFSEDDFDAKVWLNNSFRSNETYQSREQFASTLVMKLHVFIQEINKSIEEISDQAVTLMPKVLHELEAIQHETETLQAKMKSAQQDVRRIEKDTTGTMENLLKIDLAKTRMLEVEMRLKELDNWSTLNQDIQQVFTSGDPDAIMAKLLGMQQCLDILGPEVPDYKQRTEKLAALKDQFVTMVSPSVVAAFSSQNVDTARYFVKIFGELNRTPDLHNYYKLYLKTEINRIWSSTYETNEVGDISEFANSFYDSLVSCWHTQRKWLSGSFTSAGQIICDGFAEGLKSLDPPLHPVLSSNMDTQDALQQLLQLKQVTDNFARTMASNAENCGIAKNEEKVIALICEIYKPLQQFILSYQQYEQSYFLNKANTFKLEVGSKDSAKQSLDELDGDIAEDDIENVFEDFVNEFMNSIDVILNEGMRSVERCQQLTHWMGLPLLTKAFNTLISNYSTRVNKRLNYFKKQFLRGDKQKQGYDSGAELGMEKWDVVRSSLTLVQACGTLFVHFHDIENEMRGNLQILRMLVNTGEHPSKDSPDVTISCFDKLLYSTSPISKSIQSFMFKVPDDFGPLMPETLNCLKTINENAHTLALDLVSGPIKSLLSRLPSFEIWSSTNVGESLSQDLPAFALAPQEYITKVGQYLMTLAHHIEPLLIEGSFSLVTAARYYQLPHTLGVVDITVDDQMAGRLWLESAAGTLMAVYVEAAVKIRRITRSGRAQLTTDIGYLCNVVEDLSIPISDDLKDLKALLELNSGEEVDAACRQQQFSSNIVAAVKAMTKLT